MKQRKEIAKDKFAEGNNCAQSVFLTFEDIHHIDPDTAARLVTVLGGGISKTKNICGALSGACLAMSARCGKNNPGQPERQEQTYLNAQQMIGEFEAEFGSTSCPKLLGYDISDKKQFEQAVAQNAFQKTCQKYVQKSAELAAKYLDVEETEE